MSCQDSHQDNLRALAALVSHGSVTFTRLANLGVTDALGAARRIQALGLPVYLASIDEGEGYQQALGLPNAAIADARTLLASHGIAVLGAAAEVSP